MLGKVKDLFQEIKTKVFVKEKKSAVDALEAGIPRKSEEKPYQNEQSFSALDAENASLLHTTPPKSRGVKKNFIIALMCVFAAVFIGSFFFSMGDKKQSPSKNNPTLNSGSGIQNEEINKIPGSYAGAGLGQYNNKNGAKPNTPNGVQNQNGAVSPQYVSGQQPRQIPSAQGNYNSGNGGYYYNNPSAYQPSMQAQQQNSKPSTYMDQIADYLKSPIKFSISSASNFISDVTGNKTNAEAAAPTNSASPAAAPAPSSIYGNSFQPTVANIIQPMPYTLQVGTLIPATLITGINSDLSGEVVSEVRQNVYDSVTGEYLLIPQGSRLTGDYGGGNVGNGQDRIAVNWKRLYLPNGACVLLDNMASVDGGGYPGMQDQVDNHTGRMIGATLASSVLAAGAQIAAGNTNSSDNMSYGQLATQGAATNLMNAGAKLVERDMNIKPTITIRPGFCFNVFINRDIVLQPYGY